MWPSALVDGFGRAAGGVELVFVVHERDLMGIEIEAEDFEVIDILAVEEAVPGVAGAGGLEQTLLVGGATQHVQVA